MTKLTGLSQYNRVFTLTHEVHSLAKISIIFQNTYISKFLFTLEFIWLLAISNLFPLKCVQNCERCLLCAIKKKLNHSVISDEYQSYVWC